SRADNSVSAHDSRRSPPRRRRSRRTRRHRGPAEGARDAAVHEVVDAVPRHPDPAAASDLPGRLRPASPRRTRRVARRDPRALAPRHPSRAPLRGDRAGERPPLRRAPDRTRDRDVRGDDRRRRVVGLRRRDRTSPGRRAAARAGTDRGPDARLGPLGEPLETPDRDHLPAGLQVGHGSRAPDRLHRAVARLPRVLPPEGHRLGVAGPGLERSQTGGELGEEAPRCAQSTLPARSAQESRALASLMRLSRYLHGAFPGPPFRESRAAASLRRMASHLSDLTFVGLLILVISLAVAFGFEFVNGFHDTSNAVATVIYTHSLKPAQAVVWSGLWNFLGVMYATTTGLAVAFSIVHLLPVELLVDLGQRAGLLMVASLLI